jgi:hypothetical protein
VSRSSLFMAVVATVLVGYGTPARGEVFILCNGGRLVAELLGAARESGDVYDVRTPAGVRITLHKSQVERILSPDEVEYEKLAPTSPDTAEAQWNLAAWCLDRKLLAQRKAHLERVIELDPNHAAAHRALGQFLYNGQWMTRTEAQKAKGLVLYKGKWLSPQEVEVLERKEQATLVEKDWYQKLKTWRGWLGTDRDHLARDNIRAINDPRAVRALVEAIRNDAGKSPSYQNRTLFIETLARINSPDALQSVATTSLVDPVEEVRLTCLDYLKKIKNPALVAFYVGPAGLKSKDNVMVNRAAVALSALRDRSAIGPLIDALITKHKYKVVTGSGNGSPGSISSTFGTGGTGGGGMSVGGGPKIITRELRNQTVLDALIMITGGVNYAYDVPAWRRWFATQKRGETIDARRG